MDALVTVTGDAEVEVLRKTGMPDIVDLKDPAEGSLGAPGYADAAAVIAAVPDAVETSVAVGDLPPLPGTAALAVRGAATLDPDYVKVGLAVPGPSEARAVVSAASEALDASGADLVVAGYADHAAAGTVDPLDLPAVAADAGADLVMVDTAGKETGSLFDHLSAAALSGFVDDAHRNGLRAAVAGSLAPEHLERVHALGADVVGVRGAVCTGSERGASVDPDRLETFLSRAAAVTE